MTVIQPHGERLRLSRVQRALYDFQHATTTRERVVLVSVYAQKVCSECVLVVLGAVLFNPVLLRLWVWLLKARVEFFGNSHSIGDMGAIEYYLQRKVHLKSHVMSVYLVNKPHLANPYLARFQAKAFKDLGTVFVFSRFLCRLLAPLERQLFFAGPTAPFTQHPPEYHDLCQLYNFHLERQLPAEDRSQARKLMEGIGLPRHAKFVCVHAREAGFKVHWHTTGHNIFRDVDILTYIPAIEYLTHLGFWVVRMGESTVRPLPPMERVIDYARMHLKSDFLDIVLIAECEFYFGCSSGLAHVAHIFNKPHLWTNTISLQWLPRSTQALWIPKLISSKTEGRYLTYPEVISRGIGQFETTQLYVSANLEVHGNSAEDILEATKELHRFYLGDPGYSAQDLRNQREFMRIFPTHYDASRSRARLCVSFIRRHQDLMPHLVDEDPSQLGGLSLAGYVSP